jgi:aryl-phospho-beta-D-glucosidase BglC (GH1 family)
MLGTLFLSLGACNGGHAPEPGTDTSTDTSAAALSANGVDATLKLQSDWTTGYCAEVTLKNTSATPVTSWTAVVDLNQSTLSQSWNGTVTQSGSQITVKPVDWNGNIAPGASLSAFGFCGNSTGSNYRPTLVSLVVTGGSSGGEVTSTTLTIAISGNGTTSPAAGAHSYAPGTSVSVTATPASGATFTSWSGAATGTANPVTVVMDSSKTLTASFSGSGGGGGSIPADRLTGVNWFGFETGNFVPHGLWTRDYKSMLKEIKDLGFNALRLPWCNDMLTASPSGIQINASGVDAYTGQAGLNVDLQGLTSIQVMDKILDECQRLGLKVILDNHSLAHDGHSNETLWYTTVYSEAKWIQDWTFLVDRYKNNTTVVAADLKNEPHGNTGSGMKPPATWGYDEPGYGTTDWRRASITAGQAILAVNPNIIVVVEGTEQYGTDTTWWGGNLAGVADYPITTSEIPAKNLWYSAHEYGPEVYNQSWFSAADFPDNMPAIWSKHFWFIHDQNIAPLFFGEFGIKEESAANPDSVAYKWFTKFMEQTGKTSHWAFWCMNPNSGDTGGILKDDWVSVNTAKYNLIKPYLASAGDSSGGGGGTTSYTLTLGVSGNGSTSPATGAHAYASGTSVTVTATPASGATFTSWSGAATGTANPVTVAVDGNKTLTANFSGGSSGLPATCPGRCNSATPVYPTLTSDGGLGNVTMYTTSASNGGACNYGTTKVMSFAAMSVNVQPGDGKGQWQGGRICGQCAEVTALTSQGPKTVIVRIMDKCPDGFCGIDLGGSAPGAVMLDGSGRYDGKWRFVSCTGHPEVSDGAPNLAVLNGSNAWWSRVQVRNPPSAVDSIEWQDAGNAATHGTFPYAADPENTFEVPVSSVLQSTIASFKVTVHYVDGSKATVQVSRAQLGAQGGSYPLD